LIDAANAGPVLAIVTGGVEHHKTLRSSRSLPIP
jgi:hypothetical protein